MNQLPSQLFQLLTTNIVSENNPDPVLLPHVVIPLLLCNETTAVYNTFASLLNKKSYVTLLLLFALSCYKVDSVTYLVVNSVLKITDMYLEDIQIIDMYLGDIQNN